jgi:hypothetical protein
MVSNLNVLLIANVKSVQVAKKHLATDIEKFALCNDATTATVTCLVCVGILVTFFNCQTHCQIADFWVMCIKRFPSKRYINLSVSIPL